MIQTQATTTTPSPIPPTPRKTFFDTREDARRYCDNRGRPQTDIKDAGKQAVKGYRWYV